MEKRDLFDIAFEKLLKVSKPIMLILTMLLWQVLGLIILKLVFGININNLSELSKIIYSFIFDLLFIMLLMFIYCKELISEFKSFFNKKIFDNIGLSIAYWIIGLIIMVVSNLIIAVITNGTLAANEEAVRDLIDKFPIYMAFQVAIYAPLTEEIIFRKSIREATNNKFIYVLASGLVFGGLHVISSVSSLIDLIYLVPYCSLGFVFALLYYRTNNIFSTITVHSIHNTLAILLYLIG